MENLHSDLLENILSRLPVKEALHAKRVCTTWRAILRKKIERSGFLFCFSYVDRGCIGGDKVRRQLFYEDEYDHYDHAKINYYHSAKTRSKIEHGIFFTLTFYPKDIIVGSCNGLVCFGKRDDLGPVPFLICNPLTGECVFLPEYKHSKYPGGSVSSGFGYCPKTNKYKVVTIHFNRNQMNHDGHIQVYTVGECKWRCVGSISCFNRDGYDYSSGVYANGALYWLHEWDSGCLQEEKQSQFVAFCLEGETLRHIELPDSGSPEKLLGGNNNLYLVYTDWESSCIDIWVYKNSGTGYAMKVCNRKQNDHNNSSAGWIKEFSIRYEKPNVKPFQMEYSRFTPFAITRNNEVLFWDEQNVTPLDLYGHYSAPFWLRLCCYDPNTSTLNKLWEYGAGRVYIEATPHIQSLVCLKDLGETNVTYLKDSWKLILQANNFNGHGEWIPRRKPGRRLRDTKRLKNC